MQPDHNFAPAWPVGSGRSGRPRVAVRDTDRHVGGRYVACLGGTETFGKFVDQPWPRMLEARLDLPCLNLGIANASVEASLHDDALLGACRDATVTVIEVTGAHNLTNRLYSVHPRRNDRFLAAPNVLKALYPEVDFADFCFTRHLLRELHALSPERFELVKAELQQSWSGRMRTLIERCGGEVFLLWFAQDVPDDTPAPGIGADPVFVTGTMMAALSRPRQRHDRHRALVAGPARRGDVGPPGPTVRTARASGGSRGRGRRARQRVAAPAGQGGRIDYSFSVSSGTSLNRSPTRP